MKKIMLTGVVCVGCMAALATSCAAASQKDMTECDMAGALHQLGLFRGVSETELDLQRTPTRSEGIVMLVRMLGQESEALEGSWESPFTDVAEWAQPYVGYAYENGLTNGVSATEFGADQSTSEAAYLTFMLRALGYSDGADGDFTWDAPYTLAEELGIRFEKENSGAFRRADAAAVSYLALGTKGKDTSRTLLKVLYEAGAVTKEDIGAADLGREAGMWLAGIGGGQTAESDRSNAAAESADGAVSGSAVTGSAVGTAAEEVAYWPHDPAHRESCSDPLVCGVCGKGLAEPTEHIPGAEATCEGAQVCSVCGEVLAPALGHEYTASADGLQKTCSRCGQIVHLTALNKNQIIVPETAKTGHYNAAGYPYYRNAVLVCGDYGMEYFSLSESGSSSYASLVNTFAAKYPSVQTTSLLIPKSCAFNAVEGFQEGSRLDNQRAFIQSTYAMMDPQILKADAVSVMAEHTGEYMFYRTDHHWTSLGAYYASVAYCQVNGIEPRPLSDYKTMINTGWIGSLYGFSGKDSAMRINPDYTEFHFPKAQYTLTCGNGGTASALDTSQVGYASVFINGDQAFEDIVTDNRTGRKLIVFKESYGNAFVPYMIDYFDEIIVLDIRQSAKSVAKIIADYGITDALIINNVQAAGSLQKYLSSKLGS